MYPIPSGVRGVRFLPMCNVHTKIWLRDPSCRVGSQSCMHNNGMLASNIALAIIYRSDLLLLLHVLVWE